MSQPSPEIVRYGVAVVIPRAARFLVIRRSQHVLAPGMHCFPGGGIEPGETEEEAVVREMHEELGIEVRPRRRIWRNVTAWGVALAWWQADLDHACEPICNPAEVESCAWLTAAEMARLPNLLANNYEFLRALAAGEIDLARD